MLGTRRVKTYEDGIRDKFCIKFMIPHNFIEETLSKGDF